MFKKTDIIKTYIFEPKYYEYKKLNYSGGFTYSKEKAIELYVRYKDADDLKYFNFESISEEYTGPENSYKIGLIKISELLKINSKLRR